MKPLLPSAHRDACIRIIEQAAETGRFTKKEFGLLQEAIEWLNGPHHDFQFHFEVRLSNNGESQSYSLGYNGWEFSIQATRRTYDHEYGGDTFSPYEFSLSVAGKNETGELSEWESDAKEALNYYGAESPTVTIAITSGEES